MKNLNSICLPINFKVILEESKNIGFDMPSDVEVNALLRTLVSSKSQGNCLELGTGTGLASSWILDGLAEDGSLTTVDNDQKWLNIAEKYLGQDPRINIINSDGDTFLLQASKENIKYDIIFADTWAGKYQLLDVALELLAPKGMYIIDDMLPQSNWPEGHEIKVNKLMETLSNKTEFKICSMNWSCGVVILTKI